MSGLSRRAARRSSSGVPGASPAPRRASRPESLRSEARKNTPPSGCLLGEKRKSEFPAGLEVLPRAGDGEVAHAFDDPDALSDRDRAARVESVEDMRTLQRPVVRRKYELLLEA